MGFKLIRGDYSVHEGYRHQPRVVVYYSGWQEPFKVAFARTVANEGAVPLVQMNPTRTKIAAIAAGKYDNYLTPTPMPSGLTITKSS